MKILLKIFIVSTLTILPILTLAQINYGSVKLNIKNLQSGQVFKTLYLGEKLIHVDSLYVRANNSEQTFILRTYIPDNIEEARNLISIYPLGMDIDLILDKGDTNVSITLALPNPNSEGLYTTPISITGSQKAVEYNTLSRITWEENIAAGKKRQSLLDAKSINADSIQIEWYNATINKQLNLIRKTGCLTCITSYFYKIIAHIQAAKNYFGTELSSRKELQKNLDDLERRFPDKKVVQSFLRDFKSDLDSVQW